MTSNLKGQPASINPAICGLCRILIVFSSTNHRSTTCRRSRSCSIDGCRSNHHHLLHNQAHKRVAMGVSKNQNNMKVPKSEIVRNDSFALTRNSMEGEPGAETFVASLSKSTEYLPLRTVPVILKNGSKSMRINALLDDGSTRTYVNEDVADFLGLEGEPVSLNVRLLNDTTAQLRS